MLALKGEASDDALAWAFDSITDVGNGAGSAIGAHHAGSWQASVAFVMGAAKGSIAPEEVYNPAIES